MTTASTTDNAIRKALHATELRPHHDCPDTLILNELALAHSSARIDVAVLNGCLHGYEIKSSVDTLHRLPRQIDLYVECLQKLTIVCAPRHLEGVYSIVPSWCGVMEAQKGEQGDIKFVTHRVPQENKNVQGSRLAHLLWRQEAVDMLASQNLPVKILKQPRKQLYLEIADRFTVTEISAYIKSAMASRPRWRGPQVRASYGGL
jgi:hypothetical protein